MTCSGPPLPAALDYLRKKAEIKPSSEVSPFQKQPPLRQLPYPPTLLSQRALKHAAKTRQTSWRDHIFLLTSNIQCGKYKNRNCHRCINHSTNQLGPDFTMHKVFPWFRLQKEHNHRRQLCSHSRVLCWDCYLKRNICLSEAISFCHTRFLHPTQRAIHLIHTHTHICCWHSLITHTHIRIQQQHKHKNVCQFLPDVLTKGFQRICIQSNHDAF